MPNYPPPGGTPPPRRRFNPAMMNPGFAIGYGINRWTHGMLERNRSRERWRSSDERHNALSNPRLPTNPSQPDPDFGDAGPPEPTPIPQPRTRDDGRLDAFTLGNDQDLGGDGYGGLYSAYNMLLDPAFFQTQNLFNERNPSGIGNTTFRVQTPGGATAYNGEPIPVVPGHEPGTNWGTMTPAEIEEYQRTHDVAGNSRTGAPVVPPTTTTAEEPAGHWDFTQGRYVQGYRDPRGNALFDPQAENALLMSSVAQHDNVNFAGGAPGHAFQSDEGNMNQNRFTGFESGRGGMTDAERANFLQSVGGAFYSNPELDNDWYSRAFGMLPSNFNQTFDVAGGVDDPFYFSGPPGIGTGGGGGSGAERWGAPPAFLGPPLHTPSPYAAVSGPVPTAPLMPPNWYEGGGR